MKYSVSLRERARARKYKCLSCFILWVNVDIVNLQSAACSSRYSLLIRTFFGGIIIIEAFNRLSKQRALDDRWYGRNRHSIDESTNTVDDVINAPKRFRSFNLSMSLSRHTNGVTLNVLRTILDGRLTATTVVFLTFLVECETMHDRTSWARIFVVSVLWRHTAFKKCAFSYGWPRPM